MNADIIIRGQRCRFVPHSGLSRVELPSGTRTAQIQQLVAKSYDIHPRLMRLKSRSHAWPRQVAMYLTSKLTHRSLPAIGAAFGRHHTTVLHAIRTVERRIEENPWDKADVQALQEALEA